MTEELLLASLTPYLLPPLAGGVIGYFTNALAVRMLFRPLKPVKIGPVVFHGMIPRRKPELAKAVSAIVTSELLKEESLAKRVADESFRTSLIEMLTTLATDRMDRSYGSLRVEFGEARAPGVETFLSALLVEGVSALEKTLMTADGIGGAARLMADPMGKSPRRLLGSSSEQLVQRVKVEVGQRLASPQASQDVARFLSSALVKLSSVDKPISHLVPPSVVEAFRQLVVAGMPQIIQRFEQRLFSDEGVERIKRAARRGVVDYLLKSDGGLVKNTARQLALLGRDKILKEVDSMVEANLPNLVAMVFGEENRKELEKGVWEATGKLLERTPSELLAELPPDSLDGLHGEIAAKLSGLIAQPEVAEQIAQSVSSNFSSMLDTPVGELMGGEEEAARKIAEGLGRAAKEGKLSLAARGEAPRLASALMDIEIGRPTFFGDREVVRGAVSLAADKLFPQVIERIPEVLELIGVEKLIEAEVLEFSSLRLEQTINLVAGKELRAITIWGGVLGTLVGVAQSTVFYFMG